MFRPHLTALITPSKLSLRIIMSEFSRATAQPPTPIEKPTLASYKAPASFVASPVTAQFTPAFSKAATNMCLSSELAL